MPRRHYKRVVSFPLGVGILFIPFVFSWITLKKGYSTFARFISLSWMVLAIIFLSVSDFDSTSSPTQNTYSANQAQTYQPTKQPCWSLGAFTDDFGDDTDKKYMTYQVNGTFSNSATTKSRLVAKFIIESSSEISLMLYEYGKIRVKEHSSTDYFLKIRTKTGDETLKGENWSDRVVLTNQSANKLHTHLIKNRQVKFVVRKDSKYDSLTSYSFTLPNNCLYKASFNKL